ncbi:MAG: hypothetical protein V7687_16800 [Maribacter arcticus]|uniref:hypothetical protein n=1 Tax=Maribacter arcticus TaxID=561365 RepID=UPI00300149EA
MKNIVVFVFLALSFTFVEGQTREKVWRINLLNPGIELEVPTGNFSTFSSELGIGYFGAYPELTFGGNGFVYIIAPFIDLQQKWFYNINKRVEKSKTIDHNSGNFISARIISKGNSIAENINRTSDFDFAVGPTWGIQRKYGENFHLLFDLGPQFYFDTKGNSGFYPIMFQINLGFDL